MRADRLIAILMLLQTHPRLTARAMAEKLEVTERTIHRDMLALSAAGIPVVAERGVHGGWSLLDDYKTNLTGLNESEVHALFLAATPRVMADLGLEKASQAALLKLLAALPKFNRHQVEDIRQRILIDTAGWHPTGENLAVLPVVQAAIFQERRLQVCYERGEGKTVERLCEPLGLVAKNNVWYLVAQVDSDLRTYRVGRILEAHLTEHPFTRPADFDLAGFWQQSTQEFVATLPRYEVVFRVAGEMLPFLRGKIQQRRIEQISPPDELGWHTLRILFDVEQEACLYALGLGRQVEVIAPADLREKVVNMAREVILVYSSQG